MLEAGIVAEVGRRYGVIHVAEIAVVGDIEDADRAPQGVFAHPGNERNPEVFGDLQIKGNEGGEAAAVGRPT